MARPKLRVLDALDVARTQLYHFTAIMIAGMGFFTDAYDIFSISLITDLLGHIYYSDHDQLPRGVAASVYGITLCGAVPGQLVFGWLGDTMGRKRVYGVVLVLMVFSSLASGLSFSKRRNVVAVLCFFRFWLGVAIGGDYPLSATIMSEYANKRRRGAFITAVFAMQGFGNLAAGIVGMAVPATFLKSNSSKQDYVWRIVVMFGAIPAALTYYWRMKMPETARYTALVANNAEKAASDMSSVLQMRIATEQKAVVQLQEDQYGLFSSEFLRRHGVHLLCCAVCWLLLDVTFYSLILFMKDIFTEVGLLPHPTTSAAAETNDTLRRMITVSARHTAIALFGTLPGYFFTVAFVDRIGRKRIQMLGFAMMSLFILCLAVPYRYWTDPDRRNKNQYAFGAIYATIFFFANFGPNTTTFIVPAEIFPARLRSTCHGISGAFGKVGAIVGVFGFRYYMEKFQSVLFVLVGCNLVGLMLTLLLPESKDKSLEEITGEMEPAQEPQDDDPAAVLMDEYVHSVPLC